MAIQGTARKGRKEFLIKAMIGMVIPIYAGYVLGQYMPLSKLLGSELTVSSLIPSIGNITQYTKGSISICFMAYMIMVLKLYDPRHYKGGSEHGDAKWDSWKKSIKYRHKENLKYRLAKWMMQSNIPIINYFTKKHWEKRSKTLPAVESDNRILSKHVQFDVDTKTGKINANTVCIGSPGSRKTTSIVYTNCMQLGGSKVICDPKAETTYRLAGFFENAGYKVKILDLMNMDESECFNPFVYVSSDEDIPKMVSFCFRGFDTQKPDGGNKDPFWDDANMLEICAICYLLWYDARKEDQTLPMAMKLVNLNSLKVKRTNKATGKEEEITGLTALFNDYAERCGENNMPITYFRMFNKAKDKTLSNMETTLVAKLQMLLQPKVVRLLSKDELDLWDIGIHKTVLFLKCPDADRSYNFVVSMVYMFLYKCLYYVADELCQGRGCPVPVQIIQDEFTSFPQPDNYLDIMRGCRSRNVSMFPIFQDIPSLKTMKIFGDKFNALFGQVDSWIFLGSQEGEETCKWVSDQLGEETVTVVNKSGNGSSTSTTGSKLASINALESMPDNMCIIKMKGCNPIYDEKYPFLLHPNIKKTAILRDGSGIPLYTRASKKEQVEEKIDESKILKVSSDDPNSVVVEKTEIIIKPKPDDNTEIDKSDESDPSEASDYEQPEESYEDEADFDSSDLNEDEKQRERKLKLERLRRIFTKM